MKTKKIYKYHKIWAVGLCIVAFLLLMPKNVFAAETNTATTAAASKEKEYDFNKKKSITIKEKESFSATGKYTWIKYTPSANGFLTLTASNPVNTVSNAKGYIALYNSTKSKAMSSTSILYNTAHSQNKYWQKFYFGLQKGQTYYIRIKAENSVKLNRKFTKLKDKSGANQSSALELKKNKSHTSLITAGVSDADWYKVTLAEKQKLRIYYNAKTNGAFRITVYLGKQKIASRNIYYTAEQKKIVIYQYIAATKKNEGINAGTYHIKVERANTTSSGFYKIKWN